jgi:hypothetical protein
MTYLTSPKSPASAKRPYQILWLFYRPFSFINILCSTLALFVVFKGGLQGLPGALLIKLCGYGLCLGYHCLLKPSYLFYFRNSGYKLASLYIKIFLIDFAAMLPPLILILFIVA